MDSMLQNGSKVDSGVKNFPNCTEQISCYSPQSNWKESFPYRLDNKSSKNICLLDESVVTIKKMGSDAMLRVQKKLSDLQKQLEDQKKKLLEAKEETSFLKEQLLDHSKFSTSLGAVLGNLLWHASKIPDVVDVWIAKFQPSKKLDEFLGAVNGTFSSFIKTYGEAELPIESDECQFVMSLLGVTANASRISIGREFIVTRITGQELIKNLVEYFSYLQFTTPRYDFWRLILTILYNISLNVTGVQLLLDFQVADKVLSQCFNEFTPKEINLRCLSILHSITYDLADPKHLQEILLSIPLDMIEKVALAEDYQMNTIIKEIKKNLKIALNLLHTNKQRPSDK